MHSFSQPIFPEHLLCARLCLGAGNTGAMNKIVVALGTFDVFPLNFSPPPSSVQEVKTLTKRIVFHFSRPTKEYEMCVVRERDLAREKTLSFAVVSQNKGSIFVSPCSKNPMSLTQCPYICYPHSLHS